jgi:hypothetical protein
MEDLINVFQARQISAELLTGLGDIDRFLIGLAVGFIEVSVQLSSRWALCAIQPTNEITHRIEHFFHGANLLVEDARGAGGVAGPFGLGTLRTQGLKFKAPLV